MFDLIKLFYLNFVWGLQSSFKCIDPKIAKNQFMKWKENIKTRDDYINYSKILIREHMDYSKPLWEFHVIENYSDDMSDVIFRMHHSLSDGVGFVSMMSCVNDDKFSLKINKEFTQLNFFQRLILTVWSPFIEKTKKICIIYTNKYFLLILYLKLSIPLWICKNLGLWRFCLIKYFMLRNYAIEFTVN